MDVEDYLRTLPSPATWERVEDAFWYVRIPGTASQVFLRIGFATRFRRG